MTVDAQAGMTATVLGQMQLRNLEGVIAVRETARVVVDCQCI